MPIRRVAEVHKVVESPCGQETDSHQRGQSFSEKIIGHPNILLAKCKLTFNLEFPYKNSLFSKIRNDITMSLQDWLEQVYSNKNVQSLMVNI